MADIRAINQSEGFSPFWDFVASMNHRDGSWGGPRAEGPSHRRRQSHHRHGEERGHRHGHEHEHGEGHGYEGEYGQDNERELGTSEEDQPMSGEAHGETSGEAFTHPHPPPPPPPGPHPTHRGGGWSRGPHGGSRGGHRGSRGWEHGCGGRREGFGGRRGMGPFGMPFDFPSWFGNGPWGDSGQGGARAMNQGQSQDFKPSVDIFDAPSTYIVHASLPGAAKSDIGVSWDPEKSVLLISGVVHRPGDEEFLKTLAMGERQVGAFERKVYLGTTSQPAHVDEDGISAKLEDGILRVEVPKIQKEEGYVTVRKVDVQ